MDPATLTTAAAAAPLDPGSVVGLVVALLALFGAPWWVGPAVRLAAAAFFGLRAAGVKIEKAPPPVSDGGTAEDEETRSRIPPNVTQPIRPARRDPSDGMG
jgi:hypothetical protein